MHLRSLKVFCDVARQRSFSRAADENGISQSGVSQVVHQLEERLNVKLIDRSRRPFVLTPEGQTYYDGCRKIVQRYTELEDEVRPLHQEVSGRVSVASIYSVGLTHLNRDVQDFLSKHPKANVRVEYQHPERVYELVHEDQVELGLVSYPKESRSIKAIAWREEPMMVVCAPNHPLALETSVRLSQLDGCDMVGFIRQLRIRREVDRVLAVHQTDVRVVMEFDNIETIKRAIEINAGISLLPEPTVEREVRAGTLVAVPIQGDGLTRPLGIIHRHGKELSAATRSFIRHATDPSRMNGNPDGNGPPRPLRRRKLLRRAATKSAAPKKAR